MYPFLENTKTPADSRDRRPKTVKELTADVGYLYQLSEHNAALKFRLSLPANDVLNELAQSQDVSANEWLRGFFAMHCYGTYSISKLLKRNSKAFKDAEGIRFSFAPASDPPRGMISQPVYFVPELGKNVAPVKVWLAEAQKADLKILADHAKITLSEYCREIVTARILGHGTLPMRPEMLECAPSLEALAWTEDVEAALPYVRVSKAEFEKSNFGYRDSEWVPEPEDDKPKAK